LRDFYPYIIYLNIYVDIVFKTKNLHELKTNNQLGQNIFKKPSTTITITMTGQEIVV